MAIAFDAKSQLTATSSTTDGNWTHTPVGTPAGVIVLISQGAATTDQVVGVTYGGVAMTRVGQQSQAGGGDPTAAYIYFLGENVPSGAQTVSVDVNAANAYAATAVTVTADSGKTAVDVSYTNNGTAANPTHTLDYTDALADWIALVVHSDGSNTLAGVSINTGTSLYENDMGSQVGAFSYSEGTGGTSFAFTTTANNASWAAVGVVVKELAAAPAYVLPPIVSPIPFGPSGRIFESTYDYWTDREIVVTAPETNAPAELTTATVVAESPTTKVSPTSQSSAVTAAAQNATSRVSPTAGVASVGVAAENIGGNHKPVVGVAPVGAAALDATIQTSSPNAQAQTAGVTVTSETPQASISTGGGEAGVGSSANGANGFVKPGAGAATAASTSNSASGSVAPTAQSSNVTGAANNTTSKVSPTPTTAPVNAVAHQPTVVTGSFTNAAAGAASVTVTAGNNKATIQTGAQCALVSAIGENPSASIRASTTTASAFATSTIPTILRTGEPRPGVADVTATVGDAASSVKVNAEVAIVVAAALVVSSKAPPQLFQDSIIIRNADKNVIVQDGDGTTIRDESSLVTIRNSGGGFIIRDN